MEPRTVVIRHPEPVSSRPRIRPVFLPHAGCPGRCVFCAQETQTGVPARSLEHWHDELSRTLERALGAGDQPKELAFYGSTFTALDPAWQQRFLDLARRFRSKGVVSRVRCSTRPDALDPGGLARLRRWGLDMVEVGVQSFQDAALKRSGRGYAGRLAREACAMVHDAGLALGVQLMPGMPGLDSEGFLADAAMAGELEPETARLYPCLVIRGAGLEKTWRAGTFIPLGLEQTVALLARALLALWPRGVHVIRMGLAPEPELVERVLAGPWHPALGLMARSRALQFLIMDRVSALGGRISGLAVPRRLQGEFWGHRAELRPGYEALGATPATVRFEERDDILLLREPAAS